MPKINFIIHFFLEIYHFRESYSLIGWHPFGPSLEIQNFARYGIGGEISATILVSISDYFQEKLMTKFFKKPKKKKNYFRAILGPFCPNLGKHECSWKIGVCLLLDIPIIYHCAKSQKKLFVHFWEKRRIDGETERQTWFKGNR